MPRPERRKQYIDLVVSYELLRELGRALAVRLIVVLDQLDLHLCAADIDAAAGIDLLEPHLEDNFLLFGFVGDGAGEPERRSDFDVGRHYRGRR